MVLQTLTHLKSTAFKGMDSGAQLPGFKFWQICSVTLGGLFTFPPSL